MEKLRVTYVHKVSNPRDQNNRIPHAVMQLDLKAITDATRSQDPKLTAKVLRDLGVLCSGVRVREQRYDRETHTLHVFPVYPKLSTYWHCVSIELRPTCEPLTADKAASMGIRPFAKEQG
jgi:hypothetical protein